MMRVSAEAVKAAICVVLLVNSNSTRTTFEDLYLFALGVEEEASSSQERLSVGANRKFYVLLR